ncbi:capsule assembly Wzi family protein [Spirosoma sp. RP8]|uniref:Capsule assembly Wzi family protein n=1 Tax=Spirosoma liriopis TaxID=2937440 RepID=A0ABT0HPG0_9BACT|nr:capsule assembly Wzi family protein [Spirosoma liriopis]MCK8493523.1 capsule assembly Wzi family protein [Spirosoma liriopis]
MPIRLRLVSFFWVMFLPAWAQSGRSINYSAELGGLVATTPQIPFWLRSNQYGTVPLRGSFGTVRLGAEKTYRPRPDSASRRKSRFDWGFGVNVVANAGYQKEPNQPTVLLPQAYVKLRFGALELVGGNRMEVFGLGDTVLTSGFVAWSGNAIPFPKIQLHTPDFVPIGFTKNLIAIRAGYAHGWFANSYIQGSYLHQKYIYARLGKPSWRMRFYGGLNHQVQWGGHADYLVGTQLAVNGHLPTSFQDYLSMVIGHYPDALQNDRFTDFDGTNRVGNHIGSYDVALEWIGTNQNWLLYHQHIYEDASGLALQNVPDGLTGLRFLNHNTTASSFFKLRRWVVECLSTTNQSGPTFDQTARYQGGDNYFNHSQYKEGWTYRGKTIGTPFLAPYTTLAEPVANLGGSFFPNNRVVAWYTGMEGVFRHGPSLKVRLSYSRNFGTFNQSYPHPFHQFSALASAQWSLSRRLGTTLLTTVAIDRGELFPNTVGSFVSIRKVW